MRREGGFSTTATVIVAVVLAMLVAPLLMTWVVVDVHTMGGDRVDLTVPVPLVLARMAVGLVPVDRLDTRVPERLRERRESVLGALRELERCPDAELVSVVSPQATVHVAKRDGRIAVDVQAPGASVRCALPIRAALRALERWDWRTFEPGVALDLIAGAGRGELVAVNAREARVTVRIW
jgi:hypothetical protein